MRMTRSDQYQHSQTGWTASMYSKCTHQGIRCVRWQVYNSPEDSSLGMLMTDCLDWVNWGGKVHQKYRQHHPTRWGPRLNRQEKAKWAEAFISTSWLQTHCGQLPQTPDTMMFLKSWALTFDCEVTASSLSCLVSFTYVLCQYSLSSYTPSMAWSIPSIELPRTWLMEKEC